MRHHAALRAKEMFLPHTDWNQIREQAYPGLMADFLRRTDLADPAMVEWAAPLLLQAEGDSRSIARRLRMAGEPLSADERRQRGFAPRLQIGSLFADALRPKGLNDPELAAMAISHFPFVMVSRGQMRWLCQTDGVKARLLIRDDEKTCLAARPYMKQVLRLSELPVFPLAGCDKLICRCNFDRSDKPDWGAGRRRPEQMPDLQPTKAENTANTPKPASSGSSKWVLAVVALALLVAFLVS